MENGRAVKPKGRKLKVQKTLSQLTQNELLYIHSELISMMAMGSTIEELSESLGLTVSAVRTLRQRVSPELLEQLESSQSNKISELVEENLERFLRSTIKIAEVVEDEVWLKAQRAPELATLLGVISDKTFRIFAAAERANERRQVITRLEQSEYAEEVESRVEQG